MTEYFIRWLPRPYTYFRAINGATISVTSDYSKAMKFSSEINAKAYIGLYSIHLDHNFIVDSIEVIEPIWPKRRMYI